MRVSLVGRPFLPAAGAAAFVLLVPGAASSQHLRVTVRESGVYQIVGSDLLAAGVPSPQILASTLRLSTQGQAVACRVEGAADGRLTQDSSIVFCGVALDTKYTDTNVYWLTWGDGPGPRMGHLRLDAARASPIRSFRTTQHLEENHAYAYLLGAPEKGELDPWYWLRFRPGHDGMVSADLPRLVSGDERVTVRVGLRGHTSRAQIDPDHHVAAHINDEPIGEVRFDGQAQAVIEGVVPLDAVTAQGNRVLVRCPGDTEVGAEEEVGLDWVEVEYPREFAADDGQIEFSLPAGTRGTVSVTGLGDGAAEVYQLIAPNEVLFGRGPGVAGGKADIPLRADREARFIVTTEARHLRPESIALAREPYLRSAASRADLIIIAHDTFCEAVNSLVELRERQGLAVDVVPVSQVYEEFSHGIFTPVAIRDFLKFAYRNWDRPAPRYALLVGDASYDYRDYLGTGERNYVPAYPVRVRNSIETPTDAYYVCFEGDDSVPEMIVGRLPGRTPDQVRRLCERIVAYETNPPGGDWRARALTIADHELHSKGAAWFENASEADASELEHFGFQVERVYTRSAGVAAELPADENRRLVRERATPVAVQALQQGCSLFLFQGHGAAHFLSRQRVLQISDVTGLNNQGRSPLGVLVTCFSGAFDDPECEGGQCIAERMLNAPSGLIACIGPTRLGGLNVEAALLQRLLNSPATPVGEAFAAAKQDLVGRRQADWELTENYNLLGDPLLTLELDVRQPEVPSVTAGRPAEDLFADANGNRVADVVEGHAANGSYRRFGPRAEQRMAAFCEMAAPPSREDVAVVERFGGWVMDISGPPWAMEVVLPASNVIPFVRAMPSLAMLRESTRYGRRVDAVRMPLKALPGKRPRVEGGPDDEVH